jgi:hypothetical protein
MLHFISYINQHLDIEQISHYANQYMNVDMWQLTGQDENYFPFIIGDDLTHYRIVYWSKKHGIIKYCDADSVRYHAFLLWLLDNMHPVFANQQQAEDFAKAREWPRVD